MHIATGEGEPMSSLAILFQYAVLSGLMIVNGTYFSYCALSMRPSFYSVVRLFCFCLDGDHDLLNNLPDATNLMCKSSQEHAIYPFP